MEGRRPGRAFPLYLLHAVLVGLFLLPFAWTLSSSLKPRGDIPVFPPQLIPLHPTLENYTQLWSLEDGIFRRYFLNSVVSSVGTLVLVAAVSTLAGYSFAQLRFRGREPVFVLLLAALMIPFQALLIPLFTLLQSLGLLNSYQGLILIFATFQIPFATFMMRNAFASVPSTLREAALLDGGGEWSTLRHVMLPLVWPGLVTVAIYSFYVSWNEFIVPSIFTTDNEMRTLTVGLQQLAEGRYGTRWEVLTTGSIVSFIPVMLLFAFLQRYFIRGLTGGALK